MGSEYKSKKRWVLVMPAAQVFALANALAICGLYLYVFYRLLPRDTLPYGHNTIEASSGSHQVIYFLEPEYFKRGINEQQGREHNQKSLQNTQEFIKELPKEWDSISRNGALRLHEDWSHSRNQTIQTTNRLPGYYISCDSQFPMHPYCRITFSSGEDTGVVILTEPFYNRMYYRVEAARAFFWRLKAKGHVVVGSMSYQNFPASSDNPFDDRHVTPQDRAIYNAMDAWLHCSRNPDIIISPSIPRLMLSISDFLDPMQQGQDWSYIPDDTIEKEFDAVVFSGGNSEWSALITNWTLAKASMKRLVQELDFKILVLGRNLSSSADADLHQHITTGQISNPQYSTSASLMLLQKAKALLVPNTQDASPRIITEALSLNIPVVMNHHITGGWKYVNEETGEFFSDSEDVVHAFGRLRNVYRAAKLRPREWFRSMWGSTWSGLLLQAFLEAVVGKTRLETLAMSLNTFQDDMRNLRSYLEEQSLQNQTGSIS